MTTSRQAEALAVGKRLITTFGLGYLRPAPGTWGSLPPCAGCALMAWQGSRVGFGAGSWGWYIFLAFCALYFSWVCIKFGDRAEQAFGRKDPSQVVADETAGMAVTLLCLPLAWVPPTAGDIPWRMWAAIAIAFILFRIADIVKLPPARGLQRLKGGWGILVDDLIAGVQAGVVLVGVCWLWKHNASVL